MSVSTNGLTIYDKEIKVYEVDLKVGKDLYAKFSARAIPSPNSQAYMANVLLSYETKDPHTGEDVENSIIIGADDVMDFIDDLMNCYKNGETRSNEYSTTLATGFKVKYEMEMVRCKVPDCVTINIIDEINSNVAKYHLTLLAENIESICKAICDASDQAMDMLEANRRLDKQMTQLKNDMKAEKVHELYFEIYDENPKIYSKSKISGEYMVRTYKITARDKESKPLYSFLRNMHLTCVPLVDYRDFGKEFLGCPFVFSDEMIELGKKFIEKKKSDVHNTVDNRINKNKES